MDDLDLNKEIQKELEFNFEKEKLKETIKIINKEILNYLNQRKETINYITEYRKEFLDEYRDDEDEIVEYFDHEKFIIEEEFKFIDKRLKELTILSSSPYFGKIMFNDDELEETIYIGRFGLTLKDSYTPLVVDWRAPVSALFYSGNIGKVHYNAPMGKIETNVSLKRQLIIKKARLLGLFDTELNVKDDILQMVLSRNTADKLKDIIMTIQGEQDNLIRQPRNKTIIVDGVAGSGKTTIALHRVAYLLYNYRDTLQDKVLILGPNDIFIDYISMVLPSLGEVGVKQTTFRDFALKLLDIENIMSFKDYMEKITNEDDDFVLDIIFKNSTKYIDKLDKFIEDTEKDYFNIKDVKFYDEVIMEKKEIEEMFFYHFKFMPLFKRSNRIKRVIYSRIKDYRDAKVREIQKKYEENLKNMTSEGRNLHGTKLEFERRLQIREVISEVIRRKKDLSWLNNPSVLELYNNLNEEKELIQDDLAAILYLKIKLEGLKYFSEIKHVVIDEAQDYSALEFKVIKELTGCASMTILGDKNQRLIPENEGIAMENLDKYLDFKDIEYFKLDKSYRSTQEIMEYANNYLKDEPIIPLVRSGEKVVEKQIETHEELKEEILKSIKAFREKGYESIAVICKNSMEVNKVNDMIKDSIHIKTVNREDIIYTSGESIVPSYFAKGLEFDAVILIDSSVEDKNYEKMMYVMATRALHELKVYKIKESA
ncbi:DNA helicase [Clostridium tetani]|uniref:HelD family protein n=1 Tax=Clostridium tetani TaxID=1513 RepID=UPI00051489F0|nr:UvrD-helicase domain-containing protein [Clostridium tetani]AVP54582.1 ATP-dependent DNA helicase [Clostridium tetani]KGI36809.1 ATP-dependent DNA helicase [Clostridium tetani ATCC 9441]RXM71117.1 ATP-dependent DNA helicase [Clostridium tetani]RXM71577.1 ATP-dependent DNA helicase [Clostridium tetani]SUY67503.1 ATP-dependent DNA helicase rep [Clostridium tetani]